MTLTSHWSKADTKWNIDKDNGPESGGQTVNLTPPPARGIRFSQADAGDVHSGAVGSDGNIYSRGDNTNGQLGRNTGGTWKATTPAHMLGTITVNIDWTLNGAAPTCDISNHYRYKSISVLPLTGGTGKTLLLMAGLLAATGAVAIRRHRLETLTQQK